MYVLMLDWHLLLADGCHDAGGLQVYQIEPLTIDRHILHRFVGDIEESHHDQTVLCEV